MFHYTNTEGYNAVRSQSTWLFKAKQPPGDHPKGAYFTILRPGTKNLAKRLFIRGGSEKTEFVFQFSGDQGLLRLPGGRGDFILYSPDDYPVEPERQQYHGSTSGFAEIDA